MDERMQTSSQPLSNILSPDFGVTDPASGKDIRLEDFIQIAKAEIAPAEQFFMNYRCAIMQVETKFQILSKQFSVQYDDNPIDTIKSRIKTYDSIIHKTARYGIPCTLPSIEQYINDIAGVRVICSFEQDLYRLADCFYRRMM